MQYNLVPLISRMTCEDNRLRCHLGSLRLEYVDLNFYQKPVFLGFSLFSESENQIQDLIIILVLRNFTFKNKSIDFHPSLIPRTWVSRRALYTDTTDFDIHL